jgi:hypothetical protein
MPVYMTFCAGEPFPLFSEWQVRTDVSRFEGNADEYGYAFYRGNGREGKKSMIMEEDQGCLSPGNGSFVRHEEKGGGEFVLTNCVQTMEWISKAHHPV